MSNHQFLQCRRRFLQGGLALVGSVLVAGCSRLSGLAGQTKIRRVGLFHVGLDHVPASLDPLREELATLGYVEGQGIELDWRNLGDEAAARTAAQEFVRNGDDLIVAFENQTMRAATMATERIPVVFLHVDDPVANGWVRSLQHPGGNLTGFVGAPDLPGKRIEYFKQLIPALHRLLILLDPSDPITPRVMVDARKSAGLLGIEAVEREATSKDDLDRLFRDLAPGDVDGIFIASRNLQTNFTIPIISMGLEKRLAVASHRKEFVQVGALFSYGPDQATTGRTAAHLMDKIFKGANPGDVPVEQMDVLELVISLKVAQTLGLTLPSTVLAQATRVLQ